jgi:hypothetical protein
VFLLNAFQKPVLSLLLTLLLCCVEVLRCVDIPDRENREMLQAIFGAGRAYQMLHDSESIESCIMHADQK